MRRGGGNTPGPGGSAVALPRVGSAEEKERRTEGPRGRVHSSWSQQKQLELQDGHGRGVGLQPLERLPGLVLASVWM